MPAYIVLHQFKVHSAGWRHLVAAPGIILLGGTQRMGLFLSQQRQQDLCRQLASLQSAIISIFHFGNLSYELTALGQIIFMQDF